MNSNLQQVNGVYFFIMLITSALAILLIRYTVTLRRYLKEFTRVSKKVSNKEFHTRFNTYVKGELGELSKNFNYMIQIMDSTIEEVEYKHRHYGRGKTVASAGSQHGNCENTYYIHNYHICR